jgi:prepilin-type N-terminal cleavage/methylation domain-containing protein
MPSNRAPQRGFSLLELIIVLMVMISLLAIAWPNLQRPLRRTSLSEAAQTLRSAIDDSRYLAITTGKPVFVQLRQGADVLQAGTFDDFMSAGGDIAGTATTSLQTATINRAPAVSVQAGFQSAMQTWTLPESVVISDVRWTLEAPAEELGEVLTEESTVVAEVQSDAIFDRDGGAARQTWWLPLVATGQGRDAAIVLLDTSINEETTVTFASATGALEIVR